MRKKQDKSLIDSLLDYSNRYTGPETSCASTNSFNTAEEHHKKLLQPLYALREPATKASFEGVCRKYVDWCNAQPQIKCAYKFFAYPADTVEAFLESERLRHLQQGNKPGLNVENTYTEVCKLSRIQGCPSFTQAEEEFMKSAVVRARDDSRQQELNAKPDLAKTKANRSVLTDEERDQLLKVCAQGSDRLAAARFQVILLVGCATGFRACGMIHQTWFNLIKDVPNQFNTSHPQQLDLIGIGINRHKTYNTGKVIYTGVTRHAMADRDAPAALGELLAVEVHHGLRLLEQIRNAEEEWVKVQMLFPGYAGKSDEAKTKQISNLMNRMTSQVEGWDKDKVTGLMRKTCVADTRAAGASASDVSLQCGWINGTQDRSYARATLQATMDVMTKAAGFVRDFPEHHYLGRAEVPVPRNWYDALLPGLTSLLDTISGLPHGVAETLQCIELFVQAFWQALPIRMLKYGRDLQSKQLTAVQDVINADAYAVFAQEVREAEFDSMTKLGLKVPYLSEWADEQAAAKRPAEGPVSDAAPACKRQKVELLEDTAGPESALATKRREYAAHLEAMECARLDIMIEKEQARLAREQAEAEAAIAADKQAVELTYTALAAAHTERPCSLYVQSSSAVSELPVDNNISAQGTTAIPAQQKQALSTSKSILFRGDSVAAIWKEWQHGGEYASVKSLLRESKRSGKLTWRGSGRGKVGASERTELSRKKHLPQAIEALIRQGVPELEAVRQIDELLLLFGAERIREKFDAFWFRSQMNHPMRGLNPEEKGKQRLNANDPGYTVKAFNKAFELLLQAATIDTVTQT